MRDYNYREKWQRLLTPDIVSKLTIINEFKGEQKLFVKVHKDELSELIESAKIQSTEASNKIDGICTTDDRVRNVIQAKALLRNKDESEIAGYKDVLNTIINNFDYIPINANYFLQLHSDLYKFIANADVGRFKTVDNYLSKKDSTGKEYVCFQTVPARKASEAIDAMCIAYKEAKNKVDPLILSAMFVLDFLCVHPFDYGNGRMSRLITLLLLCQSGFIVGKFISIEKIIEQSTESYYEAICESSKRWHENNNDYAPFVDYMLGVIIDAYRKFDERVKLVTNPELSKADRIREIIKNYKGTITKSELLEMNRDISDTTVQRTLASLLKMHEIKKINGGRYTKYIWNEDI